MYNHKETEWKHRTDLAIYRHPIYTKEDRVRKEEGEEEKRHRRKYEEMSEAEKRESDRRRRRYYQNRVRYYQDLCLHNDLSTFITLTFKENVTRYEDAKHYWSLGLRRLKYEIGKPIKYIAVHELQKKRGNVFHFHMLTDIGFFSYERLLTIWKYGGVHIKQIDLRKNAVRNQIGYTFKYIVKDVLNEENAKERSTERKIYCSRNLIKPNVSLQLSDKNAEDVIFENMENVEETVLYDMTNYQGIKINEVELIKIKADSADESS